RRSYSRGDDGHADCAAPVVGHRMTSGAAFDVDTIGSCSGQPHHDDGRCRQQENPGCSALRGSAIVSMVDSYASRSTAEESVMNQEHYDRFVSESREHRDSLIPFISSELRRKLEAFDWVFSGSPPPGTGDVGIKLHDLVRLLGAACET